MLNSLPGINNNVNTPQVGFGGKRLDFIKNFITRRLKNNSNFKPINKNTELIPIKYEPVRFDVPGPKRNEPVYFNTPSSTGFRQNSDIIYKNNASTITPLRNNKIIEPLNLDKNKPEWYDLLNSKNNASKITPLRNKIIEPLNLDKVKPVQLIDKLLEKNPGVFLGDYHVDKSIPKFITKSLPELKQKGVNKIFVEMVRAEDQKMINEYFSNGNNSGQLLHYLKKRWGNKNEGIEKNYFDIIKSAKENGIKVYGIDESKELDHLNSLSTRPERSNPYWKKIISENTNPKDKYLVYGGRGHAGNYPQYKGVDYMLGVPAINFKTGLPQIIKGDGRHSDFIIHLS